MKVGVDVIVCSDGERCEEGEIDIRPGDGCSLIGGDRFLQEADVVDLVLRDLVGVLREAGAGPGNGGNTGGLRRARVGSRIG